MSRPRLFVSFSGGRTSAKMAKKLKDEYSDQYELLFGFSNTGCEHEKTLMFADRCDREWGLNLVWIEAFVHHGAALGSTHKIVTFETAARKGEPFEDMIKKYGIPNKAYPHCTRELKENPIRSYIRTLWEAGTYKMAIGIRVDEPKRLTSHANRVFPLAHWFPTTKTEVSEWWKQQSFDLGLDEHEGNCQFCWKKSLRKHGLLARQSPEVFQFPARMEKLYPLHGHNVDGTPRVFFRGNLSTEELLGVVLGNAADALPDYVGSTCSESCEAFQ